ncbi:mucin-associated surface protein (MASP), putative [Trypanosoma cruzi marinkellei]|uniref:Mucin-associated surface protein (MASP), putative n=1 Tax=Trypanosoma cruzi marinkellei TaxID=85056 RepID=K2MJD6_TRYCR|nr:mucin-associated surface protein (MASP), putative [Trypanosoma cruzi marinkellei]
MAVMMTGRVLLVCALCVLWCGAGGVYARGLDKKAPDGCMASRVLATNGSHMPGRCDRTTAMPPLRFALPFSAVEASSSAEDSGKKQIDPVGTGAPGSGSAGGGGGGSGGGGSEDSGENHASNQGLVGGPGRVGPSASSSGGDLSIRDVDGLGSVDIPSSSTVGKSRGKASPQAEPGTQPPSHPDGKEAVASNNEAQTQTSASEKGQGVGENNTGGAGQSLLGAQNVVNEDSKALGKEVPLKGPATKSESSEQDQTKVPNKVTPEQQTKNEMLTPEQKANDSQSTDTSTNLRETQEENKENPASTEGTAQSKSTGSQEQEDMSSTSEEASRLEEEQSTGRKTTENAQAPNATATGKRETGDNEKIDGSDSSTAASHTTSPLLLLILACAAAVAVVTA